MFVVDPGMNSNFQINCIPYRYLKLAVLIQAFIILGISIAIEITTLVLKNKIGNINAYDYEAYQDSVSYFLSYYEAMLALVLICIAVGIIGVRQKNKSLIGCFNVCNCCLLFIFILTYIIAAGYSVFATIGGELNCQKLKDEDTLYQKASQNLCKEDCQCYFSDKVTPQLQSYVINYSDTDKTLPVGFGECLQSQFYDETMIARLKNVEDFYECSGWCTSYPIQYFNNVNTGIKPDSPCSKAIPNYWALYYSFITTLTWILIFFFFFIFVSGCIFCFTPEEGSKKDGKATKVGLLTS